MCAPLLARLRGPIERCLAEAGLDAKPLASIELVGGGTRVSCVKKCLAAKLGTDPALTNIGLMTTMNADESVARGCTLMSAILSPRLKVLPYDIVEQQPAPIKVAWEGEAAAADANSVVIFDRGSNFIIVRRVTLKKHGDFAVRALYDRSPTPPGRASPSRPPPS